ncbi:unnamed protein product [Dibothriocephalus latus]|uniref:ER membrane protein complex subunit 6 n=1 Tax=Dibothriocephalus latus TaxID=60516 RepID=A0A3P7NX33_DIBLA|nr:unnamed protein product [Dibothriocephalus latus]
MAALAGATAGVLGLTGFLGFLFYIAASAVLSILLLRKAGSDWQKYFMQKSALLYNMIFGELTTYILCWTFLYGMVHVY